MSTTKQQQSQSLCNISDLPDWYQCYEFVLAGYRKSYSYKQLLWSTFEWHNETANIWSELIPAIIYLVYLIYHLLYVEDFFLNQSIQTKIILLIFAPIPAYRMLISTFVHITHCWNEYYSDKLWMIDQEAIICVCLAYNILYTYCTLYCEEAYIFQLYVAASTPYYILAIIIVTFADHYQHTLKEIAMCSCVLVCNIALPAHIWLTWKDRNWFPISFTVYWIFELVIIVCAQLCRLAQLPEKYYVLSDILKCLDMKNMAEYSAFCLKHFRKPSYRNSLLKGVCIKTKGTKHNHCQSWYFYLCPSHTVWHIVVNTSHLLMIVVWCISFPVISDSNYCRLKD